MNEEDYRMLGNEREASPVRYGNYDASGTFGDRPITSSQPSHQAQTGERVEEREEPEEVEEIESSGYDGRPRTESMATQNLDIPTGTNEMKRTQTETERINNLESHPVALSRIETHRTQHSTTVGRLRSRKSQKQLPDFGAGKPYPPALPEREEYVVEFNGHDDPMHAQNWPMKKKLFVGGILAYFSLTATFASSIFSAATTVVSNIYGVSTEVGTLATSLYVLGYAFGPIIWAPVSELYGRKVPIVISSFGFSVFCIGVASAANLQTIMLCRFFSGLFGSCPLAVVAAVFSDMFDNKTRGISIAVFSATVFMGPLLAPFIGGFIVTSYLTWRWTMYLVAIMGFVACILATLFQEETYPPVILVDKASQLRRHTKNWGIHAKQEEIEVDLKELATKNITRPLRILFTEPIVLLISIYMAFIYGLLYLFLSAYAFVFQDIHGFSPGVGGLPYFGLVIGEVIAFITIVVMNPGYVRKLEANHNVPVPEWRLPIVVVGSVAFSIGLFWFGWTGYTRSIPWIVPTLSGLFTGFGIFTVFLQLLNYIVDAYLMFAASAIAGNTFLRSLCGCVFPLFASYMFNGIGINWSMTILGCVATLAIPMPVCFLLFGKKIRSKSKMAPAPDIELDRKRDLESRGNLDESSEADSAEKEGKGQ